MRWLSPGDCRLVLLAGEAAGVLKMLQRPLIGGVQIEELGSG